VAGDCKRRRQHGSEFCVSLERRDDDFSAEHALSHRAGMAKDDNRGVRDGRPASRKKKGRGEVRFRIGTGGVQVLSLRKRGAAAMDPSDSGNWKGGEFSATNTVEDTSWLAGAGRKNLEGRSELPHYRRLQDAKGMKGGRESGGGAMTGVGTAQNLQGDLTVRLLKRKSAQRKASDDGQASREGRTGARWLSQLSTRQ